MNKRNKYYKYLRYSNLSSKLKKYGCTYTPKKAVIAYVAVVAMALFLGLIYKLPVSYMITIMVAGILFVPKILLQINEYKFNLSMFSSANSYIEQMIYSFKRNGKLLTSLEDTISLFPDGEVHDVINEAIMHVRFSVSEDDVEQEALDKIEKYFQCSRVNGVHELITLAQRRGGNYDMSLNLLLKDRAMWADRTYVMQKEVKIIKRNIVIALIISLLLCLLPLYILPMSLDISSFTIYRLSSLIIILSCLLIYIKADKKLCISWVNKEDKETDMQKKYLQVIQFNEKKERKTSKIISIIPIAITVILYTVIKNELLFLPGMAVTVFCLNQHKIGHSLARKSVEREITKQFPKWLMDVALLLQTENVQIAIRRSVERAPGVLQPALNLLINELDTTPNEIGPYIHFLSDFTLPDVQSAMKMLYALSSGNGGDSQKQIAELIERNFILLDKAEKLSSEDKLVGMQIYILLPSLLASFKLMIDMALLMVVFLTHLSVGM